MAGVCGNNDGGYSLRTWGKGGGREGGKEGAYVTLRPAHCYALGSMIQPSLQPFLFLSDSRPQTSSAPFDSVKLSRRTYHEQPTHDRVCMYVYMYV